MKEPEVEKQKRKVTKKKRWKLVMAKVSDLDKQVQKLAKEFAASGTRSEELARQVAEASQEIESFGRDLAASQELAESLTRTVETSNVKIQRLVDEMALYKTEIQKEIQNSNHHKDDGGSSLSETLAATDQKLETFRAELSRINESIFLLRSEGKDVYEKLGEHDLGLADTRARIDSLANDAVPRMTGRLEAFEKEFQTWGDKIYALSESVTGLSRRLVAVSNNDNGSTVVIAEQLAMISQRLDGLEKGMAENGARMSELQGSVASLAKRLTSVEIDTSGPSADKFDEF